MTELERLKAAGEAPEWMTNASYAMLQAGYLLAGETPRSAYRRAAIAAAKRHNRPEYWEPKFFNICWEGFFGPASPIVSNMGTSRGLPISCNASLVGDSLDSITDKASELAALSKYGAGVGLHLSQIRGAGAPISKGGVSGGVVPWIKIYESVVNAVSQGSTRRGSAAVYLPVDHSDIKDFIHLRDDTGDPSRRAQGIHTAVVISDKFMESLPVLQSSRELWIDLLETRARTGEPYIMFEDTVNAANPPMYKAHNLKVSGSNLCSEIVLHTDPEHTFVCCLSSLNLAKYEEWKDTDIVETAIYFLDAVISEYIEKASGIPFFAPAVNSAKKSRALGLGVLGWHTLLQSKMLPFDSFEAMMLNNKIFSQIHRQATEASRKLAQEYGEPEWCKGFGVRNTHLLAIAPTSSNSTISGEVSQGIEPINSNSFVKKTAKGNFFTNNIALAKVLDKYGKNEEKVWHDIAIHQGSVQHLSFLSDLEKEVFRTAFEINQFAIIKQAAQRQKYIDQAQSLNLFFAKDVDTQYMSDVHIEAWKSGVKTLYYVRSTKENAPVTEQTKQLTTTRSADECKACEG